MRDLRQAGWLRGQAAWQAHEGHKARDAQRRRAEEERRRAKSRRGVALSRRSRVWPCLQVMGLSATPTSQHRWRRRGRVFLDSLIAGGRGARGAEIGLSLRGGGPLKRPKDERSRREKPGSRVCGARVVQAPPAGCLRGARRARRDHLVLGMAFSRRATW